MQDLGHLSEDGDGDFRRGNGADVKTNGAMDAVYFGGAKAFFCESFYAPGMGLSAPQRANIKGRLTQ